MTQDKRNMYHHSSTGSGIPVTRAKGLLEDCQLEGLYDGSTPLTGIHKALLLAMRLASAADRRLDRLIKLSSRKLPRPTAKMTEQEDKVITGQSVSPADKVADTEFAVGDMVRVRSIDEIRAMADSMAIFEGMEKFCGKYYRVAKSVSTMFEPRLGRSIKLRNTYLLDGVHCDGRRMYDHEGCNRCCYFFWKGTWLEKVTQGEFASHEKQNHASLTKYGLNFLSYFKAGEQVKVRSAEEIENQLDNDRRTGGLEFMQGMKKFCGQELRIRTKMPFLINEETDPMEMRHLRNAYILDGVTCDGQGITRSQKCDRACMYVWHRDWLLKK